MTLLFMDGLQDAILTPKPEWSTNVTWQTALTGRDGSANGAAETHGGAIRVLVLPSAAATCIGACAHLFPNGAALGSGQGMYVMGFASAGPVTQVVLVLNVSGFIEVRKTTTSGTLLGTSSGHAPITKNTWHHYAAKVLLSSTTTGSVIVQLDGVTVLTITSTITSTVTASVTNLQFASAGGLDTYEYDDLYVCDAVDATATQGQANNDFLGDVKVVTLFPTSAGDSTQWTPSTGANWTDVDETPANQTDFVSDATSGHRDLYNLTDLPAGVNTVYAIRETLYLAKSDAGSVQVKPVVKELTSGTVTVDAAQGVAVSFGTISGVMKPVKAAGTLWSAADVNGLQAGQEVA